MTLELYTAIVLEPVEALLDFIHGAAFVEGARLEAFRGVVVELALVLLQIGIRADCRHGLTIVLNRLEIRSCQVTLI